MLFPELSSLADVLLLAARVLMGALFFSSGWSHATKPEQRAKSIEMSPRFTFFLGWTEMVGATSVLLGLFPQVGALLLMGVMGGALYKKIVEWKTGFWGENNGGWFYDALYLCVNGLILTTGGGTWTLT